MGIESARADASTPEAVTKLFSLRFAFFVTTLVLLRLRRCGIQTSP